MKVSVAVLVIALATSLSCRAADSEERTRLFEGEIIYRTELEPRHPRLTEDYLRSQFGSGYTLVFKGGHYKVSYDGGLVQTVWYRADENKEYTLMAGEDVIRVADGHEMIPTPVGVDQVSKTRDIAGYRSSALVVRFDDGSRTTFWFSPQLAVDPEWFRDFRVAGFHEFYRRAHAVFLEYERQMDVYTRRYVATKVTRRAVDDAELEIPDLPRRPFDD